MKIVFIQIYFKDIHIIEDLDKMEKEKMVSTIILCVKGSVAFSSAKKSRRNDDDKKSFGEDQTQVQHIVH